MNITTVYGKRADGRDGERHLVNADGPLGSRMLAHAALLGLRTAAVAMLEDVRAEAPIVDEPFTLDVEDALPRLDRVYNDEAVLMRRWGAPRPIGEIVEQVAYQRSRIAAFEERKAWLREGDQAIELRTRLNARLNTALNLMVEHEQYNPFIHA